MYKLSIYSTFVLMCCTLPIKCIKIKISQILVVLVVVTKVN